MKLIAETAWHHDGDFLFMKNLVENIARSKADIIKFHLLLDGEEYYHSDVLSKVDLKSKIFSEEQWLSIFNISKSANKDLMLLLNDKKSVEFGMKQNPEMVEIHSVAINDIHLLNSVKMNVGKSTEIVLGVGGSTIEEIDNAINVLQNNNIILMFGFQNYPTSYENINFSKIKKVMKLYPDFKYGYADHTAWNEPNNVLITLMGAAIGMNYIEKHTTTVYGEERVDWQSAINIDLLNEIADKLKILQACEGNGDLGLNEGEKKYSVPGIMKKTAFLNIKVKSGDILQAEMISFKRTNIKSGLTQLEALNLIGKKFIRDLDKETLLDVNYFII